MAGNNPEHGRQVKTTNDVEAASARPPEEVMAKDQTEAQPKSAPDVESLLSKIPELERQPKELVRDWRARLVSFVNENLAQHENLAISGAEKYKPAKLLEGIKQVLQDKKNGDARQAETPNASYKVIHEKSEQEILAKMLKDAASEIRSKAEITEGAKQAAEAPEKPGSVSEMPKLGINKEPEGVVVNEHARFPSAKENRSYGNTITMLNNRMRRPQNLVIDRVRAGIDLIEEFDRRVSMAGSSRDREDFLQKRQAIESYLEGDPTLKRVFYKERDLTRQAASITLARVPRYQHLHAETLNDGQDKFKKLMRETWAKDLVVHGILRPDRKGGFYIAKETDLDARVALGLLKLAGIKFDVKKDIQYVAPGESVKGKINIDTGGRDRLDVEDDGETAHLDHHADESGHENSAAKEVYDNLIRLGMLKQTQNLDRLVQFVTNCDNLAYGAHAHGRESYNTLVGLRNFLSFDQLRGFFKDGQNPLSPIPEDKLKSIKVPVKIEQHGKFQTGEKTLAELSHERMENIKHSEKTLAEMEKDGRIVETKKYGKVIVDIHGKVKNGVDAVKAHGGGAFIKWMPENNSFFVTTLGRSLKAKFGQGKAVRDTMWIKPRNDKEPLRIKLSEVLQAMADSNFEPTGELKKYLDAERQDSAGTPETKEDNLREVAEILADRALLKNMLEKGWKPEDVEAVKNTTSIRQWRESEIARQVSKLGTQTSETIAKLLAKLKS